MVRLGPTSVVDGAHTWRRSALVGADDAAMAMTGRDDAHVVPGEQRVAPRSTSSGNCQPSCGSPASGWWTNTAIGRSPSSALATHVVGLAVTDGVDVDADQSPAVGVDDEPVRAHVARNASSRAGSRGRSKKPTSWLPGTATQRAGKLRQDQPRERPIERVVGVLPHDVAGVHHEVRRIGPDPRQKRPDRIRLAGRSSQMAIGQLDDPHRR